MNTTAEVYLWGTRIGIIHQDINKPYSGFEYDNNFINAYIDSIISKQMREELS